MWMMWTTATQPGENNQSGQANHEHFSCFTVNHSTPNRMMCALLLNRGLRMPRCPNNQYVMTLCAGVLVLAVNQSAVARGS